MSKTIFHKEKKMSQWDENCYTGTTGLRDSPENIVLWFSLFFLKNLQVLKLKLLQINYIKYIFKLYFLFVFKAFRL